MTHARVLCSLVLHRAIYEGASAGAVFRGLQLEWKEESTFAQELLVLAARYRVRDLIEWAATKVCRPLKSENAREILTLAKSCEVPLPLLEVRQSHALSASNALHRSLASGSSKCHSRRLSAMSSAIKSR